MKTFRAKYRGSCSGCLEDILVGDLVYYDSPEELVHNDCPDIADTPVGKACPSCFTIPARSGACGCM